MLEQELLQFVKLLLRLDGTDLYDLEIIMLVKSSIQIMEKQGVFAPPTIDGHEMYAQCITWQVALNIEGFEIRESRMTQLRAMYDSNIMLLKGETYE